MIYTVTCNPSLDYIVSVDGFKIGKTNRTKEELLLPGGKGINVSIVLSALGQESVALGFLAGFVGEEIKRQIQKWGIQTDFIDVKKGVSRINVKLRSEDGTEINGMGPKVSSSEVNRLFDKLQQLSKEDVLILAGSVPSFLPEDIYQKIMLKMVEKDVPVVVDATSDLLRNVLCFHPFLIKPNQDELSDFFGVELKEKHEIVAYARRLKQQGARNVLVSLGEQGAILVTEEGDVFESVAPKGIRVSSVGSGDSMVAGFLTGYLKHHDLEKAMKLGIAAGTASAFTKGLATGKEIAQVYQRVVVNRWIS